MSHFEGCDASGERKAAHTKCIPPGCVPPTKSRYFAPQALRPPSIGSDFGVSLTFLSLLLVICGAMCMSWPENHRISSPWPSIRSPQLFAPFSRPNESALVLVCAEPDGAKTSIRYPGETFSLRLTVRLPATFKAEHEEGVVEAEVMTNLVDAANESGAWVVHSMVAEPQPPAVGSRTWRRPDKEEAVAASLVIVFFVMLYPSAIGKYHFKLRARVRNVVGESEVFQYYGGGEDKQYKLRVVATEPESRTWTAGPTAVEIHPNIYVGNFMAACAAPLYGFTAILNVAEELDVPIDKFQAPQPSYKKIGLPDGTINPISLENILAAVRWLETRENGKVLIHCRAGCGRSGSIAIAYKCKKFPLLSYDDVLNLIWKFKSDITPHKNLKQTIESIKWD